MSKCMLIQQTLEEAIDECFKVLKDFLVSNYKPSIDEIKSDGIYILYPIDDQTDVVVETNDIDDKLEINVCIYEPTKDKNYLTSSFKLHKDKLICEAYDTFWNGVEYGPVELKADKETIAACERHLLSVKLRR